MKNMVIALLVTLGVLLFCLIALADGVLFSDDFTSYENDFNAFPFLDEEPIAGVPWRIFGDRNDWNVLQNKWSIKNGELAISASDVGGAFPMLVLTQGEDWTDYVLESEFRFMSGFGSMLYWFRLNRPSEDAHPQWYAVDIRGGSLLLRKKTGDWTWEDLVVVEKAYDFGFWHKVKVEIKGSTVKVAVDDVEEISYDGIQWSKGSIGLAAYQSNIRIKFIEVREL